MLFFVHLFMLLLLLLLFPSISYLSSPLPLQKAEARALWSSCLLNYVACQTKLKNYTEAVSRATELLKDEPKNAKAFFRRAQVR